MSWTKLQFVEAALEEIGIASYNYDLQPSQLESAMRRLDSMMAAWAAKGIHLSYPMPSSPENSSLDSETSVPDKANLAIQLNLAILLAPSYGKNASPDTKQEAKNSYRGLIALSTKPIERQFPSTLPAGAGNKLWRGDNDEFLNDPVDPLQVNDDSLLEFE